MIRLMISEEDRDEVVEYPDDVVSIGRSEENRLVLKDKKSSRKHAQIAKTPRGYELTDLGSGNGTKHNGADVKAVILLKAGDVVAVGRAKLIVQSLDAPAAVPPPAPTAPPPADETVPPADESADAPPAKPAPKQPTSPLAAVARPAPVSAPPAPPAPSASPKPPEKGRPEGPTSIRERTKARERDEATVLNRAGLDKVRRDADAPGWKKAVTRYVIPGVVVLLLISGIVVGIGYMSRQKGGGGSTSGATSDPEARAELDRAMARMAVGDAAEARRRLESIAKDYPGTAEAEEARRKIEELTQTTGQEAGAKGALAEIEAKRKAFPDNPRGVLRAAAASAEKFRGTPEEAKLTALAGQLRAALEKAEEEAFTRVRASVDRHLAAERWADAVSELQRFAAGVDSPLSWGDRLDERLTAVRRAAEEAWRGLELEVRGAAASGKVEAARLRLTAALDRFRGTIPYYVGQELLADLAAQSAGRAPDPPAPPDVRAEVIPLQLQVDDLLRSFRFADAERIMASAVVKAGDAAALRARAERRMDAVRAAHAFARRLAAAAGEGALSSVKITLDGGREASAAGATESELTVSAQGATIGCPWAMLPAPAVLALAAAVPLTAEERIGLAVFAYESGLPKEAGRALKEAADAGGGEAVQLLLSGLRHLTAPPDGGFAYDPELNAALGSSTVKDGWITATEKEGARILAQARPLADRLSVATDSAQYEQLVGQLVGLSGNPALTGASREQIRQAVLKAARQNRARRIDDLLKRAANRSLSRLADLKAELNRRRQEAVDLVFNKGVYPDEDHGRAGQAKIDPAVQRVREIWENPAGAALQGDAVVQRSLDQIKAQFEGALKRLGIAEDAGGAETAETGADGAGGGSVLDLRTYAGTPKEKEFLEYNRRILAYNAGQSDVPPEIRQVADRVNAYREMMGLKVVELNPALVKAAQKHAAAMARDGQLWYEGTDGNPAARAKSEGYGGYVGENVALAAEQNGDPVGQWLHSAPHHRNLLGQAYNQAGAGMSGRFWCLDLGKGGLGSGLQEPPNWVRPKLP